jgi:hypothetical protein
MAILSKAIPEEKLHELFFFYFPMLFVLPVPLNENQILV